MSPRTPEKAVTNESVGELFLREVLSHPLGEASLALTFHHQELIGARWILELHMGSWSPSILKHAREEMRHSEIMHEEAARFRHRLKPSQAVRMNRVSRAIFDATQDYMNSVFKDSLKAVVHAKGLAGSLKGDRKRLANYYLLSLLLERRVMKTYPHVIHYARSGHLVRAVRKIICEERGHIREIMRGVKRHLLPQGLDLESVFAAEERAYARFADRYLEALRGGKPAYCGAI